MTARPAGTTALRILAIDTSGEACAVAIAAGGRRIVRSETIGRGHGERLFTMLQSAAAECHAAFADFDRIAVTVGPGSFTGLRVGIAAARGLALAAATTAIGVSTLAVHAATARRNGWTGPLTVLLPARGDLLYGQTFAAEGAALSEARLDSAEAFAGEAAASGAALAGAGSPAVARRRDGPADIRHLAAVPDLDDLLDLAAAAQAPFAPPRPLYLSPPDARPSVPVAAP